MRNLTVLDLDSNNEITDLNDLLHGATFAPTLKELRLTKTSIGSSRNEEVRRLFPAATIYFDDMVSGPGVPTGAVRQTQHLTELRGILSHDLDESGRKELLKTSIATAITNQKLADVLKSILNDNEQLSIFVNLLDDTTLKQLLRELQLVTTTANNSIIEQIRSIDSCRVTMILAELTQEMLANITNSPITTTGAGQEEHYDELEDDCLLNLPSDTSSTAATGLVDLTSLLRQMPIDRPTWLLDSSW